MEQATPPSLVCFLGKQDVGKTRLIQALVPTYHPETSPFGLARTVAPTPVDTPLAQDVIVYDTPALDCPEVFEWIAWLERLKPALVVLVTDGDLARVDVRVQDECARLAIPVWLVRNKSDRALLVRTRSLSSHRGGLRTFWNRACHKMATRVSRRVGCARTCSPT